MDKMQTNENKNAKKSKEKQKEIHMEVVFEDKAVATGAMEFLADQECLLGAEAAQCRRLSQWRQSMSPINTKYEKKRKKYLIGT